MVVRIEKFVISQIILTTNYLSFVHPSSLRCGLSKTIQTLQSRLQQTMSDIEKVDTLFELAWEYLRRYLPEAQTTVQQARDLLDTMPPYPLGEIHYQRFQASFARSEGDWSVALEKITPTINYYQKHDLLKWLWRAKVLVTVVYIDIGEYVLALEVAQDVYNISQKLGDDTGKLLAVDSLGMIYVLLRESEKALDYFDQAMQLAQSTDDLYMQGAIYHSLTQVYLDLNQYDKALNIGHQAVEIGEKLNNAVSHAYAHYRLSAVYLHTEDFDSARQCLETALSLVGPDRALDRLRFNIGLAYVQMLMGEAESARELFLSLLDTTSDKGNIRLVVNLHEYLVQANKMLGDFEQALHHSEAFHQTTTTLFNEERDRRIRTLEVVYRTQQAQIELEAERQRREQDRQYYENLSKMRDEFIASTTHDLKSPLSSMGMTLYILDQHVANDAKSREYITRLSRSLDSMRTLITDLLDLATLETLHAVELDAVDMVPFIHNVVEDHKIMAQSKQIKLNYMAKSAEIVACCDKNQMRRVIDNLVSNAIKYTPTVGEVFVVIEQKDEEFLLHVKDTGHGIPADQLPHIFERFYRVKNENQPDVTGTGLGLAITIAIIERHNGTISVESEVGTGTTFTVRIPLCEPED